MVFGVAKFGGWFALLTLSTIGSCVVGLVVFVVSAERCGSSDISKLVFGAANRWVCLWGDVWVVVGTSTVAVDVVPYA